MGLQIMSASWTETHRWIVRWGDAEGKLSSEKLYELKEYLAEEKSPSVVTEKRSSLMHFASITRHADVLIPLLYRGGVEIDSQDDQGATPLHWAARSASCKRAVNTLLFLHAEPTGCDDNGNTPLHYAAESGNVRAAKDLLTVCPDLLFIRNSLYQTPLARACEEEQPKMIRFLLSQGAVFEQVYLLQAIQANSSRVVRALLSTSNCVQWSECKKQALLGMALAKEKKSAYRAMKKSFGV